MRTQGELLHLCYMKHWVKMLHVTNGVKNLSSPTTQRVQKHRDGLRAAGMRPVQIWVPDTRREGFALECKRQSLLIKRDTLEVDTQNWVQAVADTTGWQ